ncbi:(pine wood nematode) hypothetical protein [Aphelenchoides besseyi]|nr:(pine wood nematode) hypothetical protein [Aphelenchoides besseyi]
MILQLLLVLILTLIYNCWFKRRGMLPGPMPFPLFGNLLQLSWSGRWDKQFANWSKKYNGMYTFWFGSLPTVLITDYDIAVEALIKNSDACSTRGDNQHFNQLCRDGTLGIVLTSGDLHREQRKFMLTTLRNFGMGTNLMQEKVLTEVADIVNGLNRDIDSGMKEIDLVRYTELGIGSVIHSTLFGYRFNQDNRAEFDLLKSLTFNLVAVASDPFVSASIMNSTIARLPIFKSRLARFVDMFHELNRFVDENIQKHVKEFDEEREPTDFIDAFLLEMKRQEESGKPNYFTLKQLRSSLIDAWFAGESQRCSNVVVQNVLRQLTRDIQIRGKLLRKGTFICPQISSMLWSEKRFPEPEKFVVERFLDQNGQLCNTELMVAFSMGKRACPGESLAKTELFLFAANLLNRFKFEQGAKAVELKRDGGGIATGIKPFTCRVTRR